MYRNDKGEREGKIHNEESPVGSTRRVRKQGTKSRLVARAAKIQAAKDRKAQGK